ncbi:unnamed protein product [Trichobilharzia regenti]|nr:unnamed protein product [Trichobilharzia regenti]
MCKVLCRKQTDRINRTQESKSAIGFVYEDSTCPPQISMSHTTPALEDDSGSEDEADSDMDIGRYMCTAHS